MVFVTFHWFLLHFVNDRNSGFREGFGSAQKVENRVFKNYAISLDRVQCSSFWRSRCHGFRSFSSVFIAFCERPKFWILGCLGSDPNVRSAEFKKPLKTCGILKMSPCWRSQVEGFLVFHSFLLHFVNDRNSRFREALEAPQTWKIEFSKMMLFR